MESIDAPFKRDARRQRRKEAPTTGVKGSRLMITTVKPNSNSNKTSASGRGLVALYRRMYRAKDAQGNGTRVPHPGDILYWAACLGAACLLILAAT